MNNTYFSALYNWLENGGYAHVAEYLATRPVTVDVMGRAPETSSTAEAVRSSLGYAEQLIQEAIDLERHGFRGDMIDTGQASEYLRTNGKQLSPQKIVSVLSNVGYIKHPALKRSGGKVRIDGDVRRIYVKRGSLAAQLPTPKAVADAWRKSQFITVSGVGQFQAVPSSSE